MYFGQVAHQEEQHTTSISYRFIFFRSNFDASLRLLGHGALLSDVRACGDIKVQVVLQFEVCRGRSEVLLSGYGRGYPSGIVSEFELK